VIGAKKSGGANHQHGCIGRLNDATQLKGKREGIFGESAGNGRSAGFPARFPPGGIAIAAMHQSCVGVFM
jgi:hypothetical protein